MIDIKNIWIPGLKECSKVIIEEDPYVKDSPSRNVSLTSKEGFDEILEQVFQDLDSENQLELLKKCNLEYYNIVRDFLSSLLAGEKLIDSGMLRGEEEFINSDEWSRIKQAAHRVYIEVGG